MSQRPSCGRAMLRASVVSHNVPAAGAPAYPRLIAGLMRFGRRVNTGPPLSPRAPRLAGISAWSAPITSVPLLTGCEIVQKLFVPIRLWFPEVMVPEHSLSSPPELLPARIVLVMLTVPELRLGDGFAATWFIVLNLGVDS